MLACWSGSRLDGREDLQELSLKLNLYKDWREGSRPV
jgi:hypothetical protein